MIILKLGSYLHHNTKKIECEKSLIVLKHIENLENDLAYLSNSRLLRLKSIFLVSLLIEVEIHVFVVIEVGITGHTLWYEAKDVTNKVNHISFFRSFMSTTKQEKEEKKYPFSFRRWLDHAPFNQSFRLSIKETKLKKNENQNKLFSSSKRRRGKQLKWQLSLGIDFFRNNPQRKQNKKESPIEIVMSH